LTTTNTECGKTEIDFPVFHCMKESYHQPCA
jgi:hypothetical protein